MLPMAPTREDLDRALAASAESLLLCDSDGHIVGVNASLCSLTGYDPQDLLAKRIGELTETDTGRLMSELRDDATLDVETGVRCKDGSTQRLQLRLRSLRVGDRPHSMVRVARRRRAADRLPEDPEFIRALLHAAGMLVICLCPEGRIVFANPAFEALIGRSFREIRGRRIWELLDDPEQGAACRKALEVPGGPQSIENAWVTADGVRKTIAWTGTRLASGPQSPPCLLLVGREASSAALRPPSEDRRLELEKRIASLTRELEEARSEHETLTYTLAHDFRAPLRAMSGLSDALIEECARSSSDEGVKYAIRIGRSAQQMDALIENLLVYNRLARMPVERNPLRLDSVLNEVVQSLGPEIRNRNARITGEISPLEVIADRSVLFLLLYQLLSNAIKFVPPGVVPAVSLRAERREGCVRLSMQDNGIGIPAEYHDVIFGLCERLNPAEAYPGTGMGLAIVCKAAERLLAKVGLESQVGKGSLFWVDLPAASGPALTPASL
jgi:PAS domain S-box-containing protein